MSIRTIRSFSKTLSILVLAGAAAGCSADTADDADDETLQTAEALSRREPGRKNPGRGTGS